jgi:ABC-2 type transport system permease protein
MNDATLAVRQVRYEQLAFWRNAASAVFTLAFPVMFLIVFGSLNRGANVVIGNQHISYNDYYVPALVTYGVMGACFTNIAMTITIRRDSGVLKRIRGTPLPPWAFMVGVIGSSVIISVALATFTIVFGLIAYQVHVPHHVLALAVTLAVGAMTFCAIGLAASVAIPNADSAPALVNLPFLLLVFISGTFFPIDQSSVLARIASYFPVRHFIAATYSAFDPASTSATGFEGTDLLVMVIWGAGALLIAARRFRWEPRRA